MSTRYRSILVPLDGSDVAEQALAVGTSLALRTGADLHLVSVLEPVPVAVTAEFGYYGVELDSDARGRLDRYVADVAQRTGGSRDLSVCSEVLEGEPATALAEYVARHHIELVVMTTHARKGLSRLWLGSVADRLLRRLSIPVLLLHPSELPQPTRFHRFLVALDGEIEEPVLAAAMKLGELENDTQYILFRVAEPAIPLLTPLAASAQMGGGPQLERISEEAARDHVESIANGLRIEGLDVTWRVVRARDVPEQVVELAQESGADCIAMGTHGARGIERLLVGSVADKVVRETVLPVLVSPVRPNSKTRA